MSVQNGQASKKVTMSRQEFFLAGRWIDANWESLKKMTRDEAATKLSQHVGKIITPGTLARVFKDIQRDWPGLNWRAKGSGNKRDRVRFLCGQILAINERIEHLALALGTEVPALGFNRAGLVNMLNGLNPGSVPE